MDRLFEAIRLIDYAVKTLVHGDEVDLGCVFSFSPSLYSPSRFEARTRRSTSLPMIFNLLVSLATLASALAAPLALRADTCAGLSCGEPFLNLSLPAELRPLRFAYNALEPFIVEDIMVRAKPRASDARTLTSPRAVRSAFTTTSGTSRT